MKNKAKQSYISFKRLLAHIFIFALCFSCCFAFGLPAKTSMLEVSSLSVSLLAVPAREPSLWASLLFAAAEHEPSMAAENPDTYVLVFSIVVLLLVAGLVFVCYKKGQLSEANRQLEDKLKRHRLIAKQGGVIALNYDIPSDTLYTDELTETPMFPPVIKQASEFFPKNGYVLPESQADLVAYIQRLRMGAEGASVDILLNVNGPTWYRLKTTFVSTAGKLQNALISAFNVTEQRESEAAYLKWKQEIVSGAGQFTSIMEINLTRDLVERAEYGENYIRNMLYPGSFSGQFDSALSFLYPDDIDKLKTALNLDTAKAAIEKGAPYVALVVREMTASGYRRSKMEIRFVSFNENREIKAYIINRDIEDDLQKQSEITARAETDPLTGAYNRATFIEKAKKAIAEAKDNTLCAFLYIDLDNFKSVNDTFGHTVGDELLISLLTSAQSAVAKGSFIGRMGGDEFMVCINQAPDIQAVKLAAQRVSKAMYREIDESTVLSVSIGIALHPRDGLSFSDLYHRADQALYKAKHQGKNSICFYSPSELYPEEAVLTVDVGGNLNNVLFVSNDEKDISQAFETIGKSHALTVVKNAEAALALIESSARQFRIAIIDLALPESESIIKGIRKADLAFAVITDKSDLDKLRLLAQSGCADCIIKPISFDLLALKVSAFIKNSDSMHSLARNSFYTRQLEDEEKHKRVFAAIGTVVLLVNPSNGLFVPYLETHKQLAGNYDSRTLYRVLEEDDLASPLDIETLRHHIEQSIKADFQTAEFNLKLKISSGEYEWFRARIISRSSGGVSDSVIVTLNNVNEATISNEALHYHLEHTALTGLYNKETFLKKVEAYTASSALGTFAIISYDIDNFKYINDQFGFEKGNELLRHIAACAYENIDKKGFGISCHIGADDFAFFVPAEKNNFELFRQHRYSEIKEFPLPFDFNIKLGVFIINDASLSADAMLDRAVLARLSVKEDYISSLAFYDESQRKKLLTNQFVVGQMQNALKTNQFYILLQPQVNLSDNSIIGAEALSRWQHPETGLISPGLFIPIFEANGFITEFDRYVFEAVCKLIQEWHKKELSLPISVNLSPHTLLEESFADFALATTAKYGIKPKELNLEITEATFAKNTLRLIEVITKLQDHGFLIEIDDFGSGYSSLNVLKDVPANVLKLDMRFFEDTTALQRSGSIVNSILRMAKWLDLPVIAEGVEKPEQAEFLRSIGCSYVQGYLYAKPMLPEQLEVFLSDKIIMPSLSVLDKLVNLDEKAFWSPESLETLVYNNFAGAAVICDYNKDGLEILRVNDNYIKEMCTGATVRDILKTNPFSTMDSHNANILRATIRKAIETGEEAECETERSSLNPKNPNKVYIRCWLRVLMKSQDSCILYGRVENTTARRTAENKLTEITEQLYAVMNNIMSGVYAFSFNPANKSLSTLLSNQRFREIFNLSSPNELIGHSILDYASADSKELLRSSIYQCIEGNKPVSLEYKGERQNGSFVLLKCTLSRLKLHNAPYPVCLAVVYDITAETDIHNAYTTEHETMQHLLNNSSCGYVIFKLAPSGKLAIDYTNKGMAKILGMPIKDFYKKFAANPAGALHPEDKEATVQAFKDSFTNGTPLLIFCRIGNGRDKYVKININGTTLKNPDGSISLNCCVTPLWANEADIIL